ncbi:carboxypeptidase regulatory-like domain-containing protein [Bacteroides oleiciplenus]|uniref:carboxypeptidase regulatory-like domain-containing protein n=1 Tax=Bacteroides oleiciplenus TaxID=626931 RepID=UPI0026DB81AB|nr:carboxypeptidase regulatory-like domain-containing protein [Bacteroides oleiciplenus]
MPLSKLRIRQNHSGYKVICLIIFLLIAIHANAQNEKFTISGHDITIKQAFEQIEEQSKYTVAYSKAQIDVERKITVHIQRAGLIAVLEQVLKNTGFTYRINELHIIVIPIPVRPLQRDVLRQTLKGTVRDAASGSPIPYANVTLSNTNLQIRMTSDSLGHFSISYIPIGRYDLQVSYLGYAPTAKKEILLTAAEEVCCDVVLTESFQTLEEVVVHAKINKERLLNPMALTGGRMISLNEANRYAGGLDDPARLSTSFAGVAGTPGTNAIAIRGNSPQFLQWKMEGIEIPALNHFADLAGVGGGLFTGFSSRVMGNSDFFTGAFPAEYNNALSGIFDMSLRNGNSEKSKHTVHMRLLGLGLAYEGPIDRKAGSSYLFNYRYSETRLMGAFTENTGISYQDLTFKLNFPTRKAGVFSVWGISLLDLNKDAAFKKYAEWETFDDRQKSKTWIAKGAGGITHRYNLGNDAYLKTSLAATYSDSHPKLEQLPGPNSSCHLPVVDIKNRNLNLVLSSFFNKKYNSRHTNRSGITITGLFYNLDFNLSPNFGQNTPMQKIVKGNGKAVVLSAYSNSIFKLADKWTASVGVNTQFFTLNSNWTAEPRLALKWNFKPKQSLSLAYGLHSRRERLDYYHVRTTETGAKDVNKNLDYAKAHHWVLTYDLGIAKGVRLKVEPYYQALYNVPVEPGTSFSIINHDSYYLDRRLVNRGKGRNYGIDITFERYLNRTYYYMFTGTIFKSEYLGGDGIWRDTRLDRGYIVNALGGKEWVWGKKRRHIFNLNLRLSYQGGDHYTPVNKAASMTHKNIVYDETKAYSKHFSPALTVDVGISYKLKGKHVSHEFELQLLNLTGYTGQHGYQYNEKLDGIEKVKVSNILPDISYRVRF